MKHNRSVISRIIYPSVLVIILEKKGAIITDKTIANNKPDLILMDKVKKEAVIIDLAHPLDHNLQKTFSEKKRKYIELAEEIKEMWSLERVELLPIVVSTNGLVPIQQPQELRKRNIPLYVLRSIQRSVILETCRIIRKVCNL